MKEKRISVLTDLTIKKIQGHGTLKRIVFKDPRVQNEEFFVEPDMVITNGELGFPTCNLMDMLI